MRHFYSKLLITITCLLLSLGSFAALKSVTLKTELGSQPLIYRLANKLTKGPYPAGNTVKLSTSELQTLQGKEGPVLIFLSDGSKHECTSYAVFDGIVTIDAYWNRGNISCAVSSAFAGKVRTSHTSI